MCQLFLALPLDSRAPPRKWEQSEFLPCVVHRVGNGLGIDVSAVVCGR